MILCMDDVFWRFIFSVVDTVIQKDKSTEGKQSSVEISTIFNIAIHTYIHSIVHTYSYILYVKHCVAGMLFESSLNK